MPNWWNSISVRGPSRPGTRHLFRHIGPYVEAVPDALLFAARDCEGALQGFAVGDYTALGTVFYLFAFRAPESPPGTADALLDALAAEGIRRGHTLLNLGLGINPGIVFFKRKVERDDPPAPRGNVMGGATASGSRSGSGP